ncbi:hypothetical protein APP_15180 [Aeribacillus pallidus]|nr:hypothetical protein APP_15180 [Aeribacillus pallidus]
MFHIEKREKKNQRVVALIHRLGSFANLLLIGPCNHYGFHHSYFRNHSLHFNISYPKDLLMYYERIHTNLNDVFP